MQKKYQKDGLTILWDNTKCIHSGICAKGLPAVFKPREKPWITMENESTEAIRLQVEKCPSKALSVVAE